MNEAISAIVGAVFLLWLIATFLVHLPDPRFDAKLRSFDLFNLIPSWTFFAPNPGTSDYHLLYRDKLDDGGVTAFQEVVLYPPRSISSAIWYPQRRKPKALSDIVNMFINDAHVLDNASMKTTLPYIVLLNYINGLPHPDNSNAFQFLIIESFGFYSDKKPNVIITSEFHKLIQRSLDLNSTAHGVLPKHREGK